MNQSKELTVQLGEKIHGLGVEIATLAVREYVGEAEDYIEEFHGLIEQILLACKDAGLAFVVKEHVAMSLPAWDEVKGVAAELDIDTWANILAFLGVQLRRMSAAGWEKTEEIELT